MNDKLTDNQALENYLSNGDKAVDLKPWHGLDPNGKRVGIKVFSVVVNEYEKALISEAATKDNMPLAGFIRQAALKRAKTILAVN